MNTRRRGSLTPSLSEQRDRVKKNATTNTENFEEQTAELGQAPVFNIHIHLPANYVTNASKMCLPKIQPVIHVHFDELADKLRNKVSQQEGGLSEKYLQTLIKQITPKFGNILFHHKNNSFNGHSNRNEINNFKPNQDLRGKDSSIEVDDTRQKQNSENSKSGDSGQNKKSQRINGDNLTNLVYNGHPIKLKKAMVVLEDILQPSSCKSRRVRDLQQEISLSKCSQSSISWGATLGPKIKIEPAPSSPTSPSVYESEKSCAGSDNFINSFSSTNSYGSFNFEFPDEEGSLKRESLASLVEGCYFSEILKKFKEKHRKYAESLQESNILPEAQTLSENNNVDPTQNYVKTQKEGFWVDQSPDVDHKQEEEEDSKDWLNCQDGIISHEIENQPSVNMYERNTEISEWSNSIDPSVEESRNEVDQTHGEIEIECLINPFHLALVESDDNEITTRIKLSSDVEDLGPVEFDSSNPTSDVVIKNEFSLVETEDFLLADTGDQSFDLTLVKEEMVSPKKGTDKMVDNENRKSRDGESGSSPKKFKQSLETAKESTTKAPRGADYIPLNISGPTEFGVVPLSNVQGYKAHAAQNFKKDMLFGKRILRFTDPEHLRMYKLKKQQKYCQNKTT